jgi:tRNA threonylcarbamoyladenosine biosynthesis protein TsaE
MTDGAGEWLVPTADAMHELGACLGEILRAGDVVLMDGELGAGKTALVRGIAHGMGLDEPVTSPTFVIAREHPPRADRPGLVHVDAYRLTGPDELDDLDLGPAMAASVTAVEWAADVADHLHAQPLVLTIEVDDDESRRVRWRADGQRWADQLTRVAGCGERSSPRTGPAPQA